MTAFATAGAGFLLAVLWFDLMFDVQIRTHSGAILPADVLKSISTYYRRVTSDASPMGRLVGAMMLVTLLSIAVEIASARFPVVIAWLSLALSVAAVSVTAARTVRNAIRLGNVLDSPQEQSVLARSIYRDHVFCFVAMGSVLALQLAETVVR